MERAILQSEVNSVNVFFLTIFEILLYYQKSYRDGTHLSVVKGD